MSLPLLPPLPVAVVIRPVAPQDRPEIDDLQTRVFGPGRFARTAYRVREGTPYASRYCLCARVGRMLIASLRLTSVTIGGRGGALLLGPLAVDERFAGQGIGRRMVADSLEAARRDGLRLVILIGDEPYYGRFGFRPLPPGRILIPGPHDAARFLAAELATDALSDYAGLVCAEPMLGFAGSTQPTTPPVS